MAQMEILVRRLTGLKEENLKLLREIDNQEEGMEKYAHDEEDLRKKSQSMEMCRGKVSDSPCNDHKSGGVEKKDRGYRVPVPVKSVELNRYPHKHVYLDVNNRSIEASFEQKLGKLNAGVEVLKPQGKNSSRGWNESRKPIQI
ncbi:unnamed protein product [Sphagnum balticum]